jgi:hypothetical protein
MARSAEDGQAELSVGWVLLDDDGPSGRWANAARPRHNGLEGAASDSTTRAVPLCYAPEGRGDHLLEDSEIASVTWTIDNLPILWGGLRPAVFSYYQSICADPDGLDAEDLPVVGSAEELLPFLGIRSINVHQISRDGRPYVGLEFACPWDEEHGLGILMHGARVVRIGGADTAFLLWMAKQDSERDRGSAPSQID